MKPITILIVDDHKLISEAWAMILGRDKRFKVIGECHSAEAAIQTIKKRPPDIILLDIMLSGINGIEAIPAILRITPEARIIGISLHTRPSYVRKMLQRGAKGYVTKNSTKEEMIESILTVYTGDKYICRHIRNLIAHEFSSDHSSSDTPKLSKREIEVVDHIKRGLSSKEIAGKLFLSVKTIEVHRYNILKKLGLKNSAALIDFANKHDLQ